MFFYTRLKYTPTFGPISPRPGGPAGPGGPVVPRSPCDRYIKLNNCFKQHICATQHWRLHLTFDPGKPIPSGPVSPVRPGKPSGTYTDYPRNTYDCIMQGVVYMYIRRNDVNIHRWSRIAFSL